MELFSDSQIVAVLGPTNTGKTYLAIERMLGHSSGMMGFPLRLLARENYDKVVKAKGPEAVALVTGEEKIIPNNPSYWICTVEAMPLDIAVEFMAIDEIQLCGDPERGHVFTDRLLHCRGTEETIFLGSDTIRPLIKKLVPGTDFQTRRRLSTLSYVVPKKLSRIPPRSAVVVFSGSEVYRVAETLRRQRGGAAVVLGALSPRTRNAQVEMFQSGEVDFLVATDAIGMGLNMDLDHVTFGKVKKFDGRRNRLLTVPELAQIAGRAGRHMNDGSFCTTAEIGGLPEEVVEAIEEHRFDPLQSIMWRSRNLKFDRVSHLLLSLEELPPVRGILQRSQDGDDHQALKVLSKNPEIRQMVRAPAAVRTLWDVCQVPDFRQTLTDSHTNLLSAIIKFLLAGQGFLPEDWIAAQIKQQDKIQGDIDSLMARIAAIRTWTFISHRGDWVERKNYWQEKTRDIEDKLSDALHERLTKQFVDRRAAAIVSRLNSDQALQAGIRANGEIVIEGQEVGQLTGFDFELDGSVSNGDKETIKPILTAVRRVIGPEIDRRIGEFSVAPDKAIKLRADGCFYWNDQMLGQMIKGKSVLAPDLKPVRFKFLEPEQIQKIMDRLKDFYQSHKQQVLGPLVSLLGDEKTPKNLRGLVFQLGEGLGLLPRRALVQVPKKLTTEEQDYLKGHRIIISRHAAWQASLMDRKAAKLKALLWKNYSGDTGKNPPVGQQRLVMVESEFNDSLYQAMGYLVFGTKRNRKVAVQCSFLPRLEKKAHALLSTEMSRAILALIEFTNSDDARVEVILNSIGFQPIKNETGQLVLSKRKSPVKQKPKRIKKPKRPTHKEHVLSLSPFAALAGLKTGTTTK